MGLPVAGEAAPTSTENSGGPDEEEEVGNEDESIVHHTASVGDVEVIITLVLEAICYEIRNLQNIYSKLWEREREREGGRGH